MESESESLSKNYEECHEHPLLLMSDQEQQQAGVVLPECSRCGEKVDAAAAPCLMRVEEDGDGFHLHKVCADAPSELHHPFHPHHPLLLIQRASSAWGCDFCDGGGNRFRYRCSSCDLDFHIKCALLTFNIAQNNLKELEHVPLLDPLIISSENDDQQRLEDVPMCFGCWEPLANYKHFSPDCGFHLHKKCYELPLKMNHMCHHKHPLVVMFNSQDLSCKICQVTPERGYVYGCSPCQFVVHIECVLSPSPALVIEDKNHPHPFTLFPRRAPFICDACGTQGIYSAYICGTCNIMVHKHCTSLPPIIKSKWHDHRIFHRYFIPHYLTTSDCIICHDEVNSEHGGYCCSCCQIIFHVNCVTAEKHSYFIVSHEDEDEISYESSITILETNDAGEATRIKHFKHIHNLLSSPFVGGYGNSCDGCMLPISDPFFYCSQCDFFLHKACAELPKKKHVWHHSCQEPLILNSENPFKCEHCALVSSAFSYECCECDGKTCLRCVLALTPGAKTSSKHEHPLFYYREKVDECNACELSSWGVFRCKKGCNFVVDYQCFSLPITARHKCDEHLLSLTYFDDNSYSESHYCDICEESRDPKAWFYHCVTCGTCAHVKCVLGKYPFVKVGSIYKGADNPHPLTFVKNMYYYPDCEFCGEPCEELAVECEKCNHIFVGKMVTKVILSWYVNQDKTKSWVNPTLLK